MLIFDDIHGGQALDTPAGAAAELTTHHDDCDTPLKPLALGHGDALARRFVTPAYSPPVVKNPSSGRLTRRSLPCGPRCLLLAVPQPQQAIDDQLILNRVIQRIGQRLVRSTVLVLIVNVVVTHVEVDHLVVLVGPNHGIVSTVPDLVWFWPGAQRKAARVDGQQNVYVRILAQIFFPPVPLIGRGPKRLRQMVSCRMRAVFNTENGRRGSPRITDVG